MPDDALVERVRQCVAGERRATAELIATLSEFDVRQLYLGQGYGSLFDYCIRSLHLSERAAGSRIAAARLARRFPIVLELIADSRVSLTAVSLLARHLNEENYRLLLEEATHKTAEMPAAFILPAENAQPGAAAPLSPPDAELASTEPPPRPSQQVVRPLAPERFKIQFTKNESWRWWRILESSRSRPARERG